MSLLVKLHHSPIYCWSSNSSYSTVRPTSTKDQPGYCNRCCISGCSCFMFWSNSERQGRDPRQIIFSSPLVRNDILSCRSLRKKVIIKGTHAFSCRSLLGCFVLMGFVLGTPVFLQSIFWEYDPFYNLRVFLCSSDGTLCKKNIQIAL